MNLNGLSKKAEVLLANARALAAEAEGLEEARQWWRVFLARLNVEVETFVGLCPQRLQDAVINHVNGQIDAFNREGDSGHTGLLPWLDRRTCNPVLATPWPQGKLPEWMVLACLEDGAHLTALDCADCGHCQPGFVPASGSFVQPVRETCWACGGRVGLLAWFHAVHAAARRRGYYEGVDSGDPLAYLVERGYRLGERLSVWLELKSD